jgi:putative transcription antitermination factor YqgF
LQSAGGNGERDVQSARSWYAPDMGRVLGIDYGTKRIGVAVSDETKRFAFPHAIVQNGDTALRDIAAIASEQGVERIVMGLSLDHAGAENPVMKKARAFAVALEATLGEQLSKPIVFVSEAFTSSMALRQFETNEKTRSPKKRHTIDDSAAALILQTFLDTPTMHDDTNNTPRELHDTEVAARDEVKAEVSAADASAAQAQTPVVPERPTISIDAFAQVEMRIGEILTAERVPDTDKLIRLTVNVGETEPRQIISGIAAWFPEPGVLVGKRVPFVTNLAPRTMRGLTSNGMILAAHDADGHFSLLEVDPSIAPGTRLS